MLVGSKWHPSFCPVELWVIGHYLYSLAGDQILYMFSVYKYSKLVVWKFIKFDINSNISLQWSTVWKLFYSNGHNGIFMRVSNQNIASGLTLQQLPSIMYEGLYQRVITWHASRITPSSPIFGQLLNWNVFSNTTCFNVFEPNLDWNWYYCWSIALCTTAIYRATLLTLWHCWSSVIIVKS
mgnify:CR=1 FL=1